MCRGQLAGSEFEKDVKEECRCSSHSKRPVAEVRVGEVCPAGCREQEQNLNPETANQLGLHVLEAELQTQASHIADMAAAEAELHQSMAAIRRPRDSHMQQSAWIYEEMDNLCLAVELARNDPCRFAIGFRLSVRLFVRRVEDAVWTQFQIYEKDFRETVARVIHKLALVDRQALGCSRFRRDGPDLKGIEKTLIALQVKVSNLKKNANSWIAKLHHEQQMISYIVQMPALMSTYPVAEDVASSLGNWFEVLAGMALANQQAHFLLKPAQNAIIDSIRSAICAGFDDLAVRAVLEANMDALMQMRRSRRENKKSKRNNSAHKCRTFAAPETVHEDRNTS